MRHKPSKFTGKSIPDEADAWLIECEKICREIECTDVQKLSFVTFLLVVQSHRQAAHASEPKTGLITMCRLAVYAYPLGGFWAKTQKLAKYGPDRENFHTIRIIQCSVHYLQ